MILNGVLRQRLPVDLNIRIDEIVERLTILAWRQREVAAHRECDAGRIEMAEVVVMAGGILPSLGRIDRNPFVARIKFRPAVITGNLPGVRLADRKSNRE